MTRGLFVTGTGTEVGKTYVACLIARVLRDEGHRVGVYKPVASGCRREGSRLVSPDAVALWHAAGRPSTLEQVCPQCFEAPLAPHLAARAEGKSVDAGRLSAGLELWREQSDIVLVEGAGGLMSPLSEDLDNADLARRFGYPLLVVAANVLGTINATLQTLIAARAVCRELDVAGVMLNDVQPNPHDASRTSNLAELESRCSAPVLGSVAWSQQSLLSDVDWFETAGGA